MFSKILHVCFQQLQSPLPMFKYIDTSFFILGTKFIFFIKKTKNFEQNVVRKYVQGL
jgi:hypothetical protein